MSTRYVIVGGGVAGIAAVETLRSHDPHAQITLVSDDPDGFYSRPGLAYYLSGQIPERQLIPQNAPGRATAGLSWLCAAVAELDPQRHQILLSSGRALPYDRLLLATGTRAARPTFPGADLAGVMTLDTLGDARRLVHAVRRGMPAVVVGGGITALELAEGLRARGAEVTYLLRGSRYWTSVLDAVESELVLERLRHDGVTVRLESSIRRAIGDAQDRLVAVETEDGTTLPCRLLAVAIGTQPRMELARQAGLRTERGILVDPSFQTSAPAIFAAGDVAQVHDPRSGQAALDTLWSSARAHGTAVAASMAGIPTAYRRPVALNITLLAGLPTTIIGALGSGQDADLVAIARGDSETWRTAPPCWVVTEPQAIGRVRLLVGETRILGALVMGDQALSRPLQQLIGAEADISADRERLLNAGHALPQLLRDLAGQQEARYAAHN